MHTYQHILNTVEQMLVVVLPGIWQGPAIPATVTRRPLRSHAYGMRSGRFDSGSTDFTGFYEKPSGFICPQG